LSPQSWSAVGASSNIVSGQLAAAVQQLAGFSWMTLGLLVVGSANRLQFARLHLHQMQNVTLGDTPGVCTLMNTRCAGAMSACFDLHH